MANGKYLYALLGGLGMAGAVYLVEAGLASAGMHAETTFLDDALLGIFTAVVVLFILWHRDTQRKLSRQKQYASVIADLNHHIRNALQVIVYRTELDLHGVPELQEIRNAVDRIDWALREILPHGAESSAPETAEDCKVTELQGEPPAPQAAPKEHRLN